MNKENLIVIIPAYEPPREFIDYAVSVAALAGNLVIVNDGSGRQYDYVFNTIAKEENVKYISYEENRGKGYALKQAFKYCAENHSPECVMVTADCDGQHDIKDIYRVAEASLEHQGALVLGSRDFDLPNVPPKSRMGNTNIRRMFRLLYGLDLSDTQTGLRGFSVGLAKQFIDIGGDRFEYEMNMLISAKKKNIPVLEIPIKTIYPDDPRDHVTHFRAVKDSARIVGVVIKNLNSYVISSALSGLLDIFIFFLMSRVILGEVNALNTLIATVIARIASSLLNYTLNRKYVFYGREKKSILKYYLLWFCQLGASYGLIFLFGNLLRLPMVPMKLVGDLFLSAISYQIQQHWVFKNGEKHSFYGRFIRFLRPVAGIFTKKYKCKVLPPDEPTVYVCRHLNMRGPVTTIVRLGFHVHPMVLSCFFDKESCYKHYVEYTFSERFGKKKKKHSPLAYVSSRVVPSVMRSLGAIPVHRGEGTAAMITLKRAIECLERGESVIVFPDKDYTAGYDSESEIYDGFLLLGKLYKRETGKSLRFVPIYIDDRKRMITEFRHITVDDFREKREEAYNHIKASINGRDALLNDPTESKEASFTS